MRILSPRRVPKKPRKVRHVRPVHRDTELTHEGRKGLRSIGKAPGRRGNVKVRGTHPDEMIRYCHYLKAAIETKPVPLK